MLDTDKDIVFLYIYDEYDLNLGLMESIEHIVGKRFASIEDVIKEDNKSDIDDIYGVDRGNKRYIVVREGIYKYEQGQYIKI